MKKKKLTAKLQMHFQEVVDRQMEENSLPTKVGWFLINRSKNLFLLSDWHTSKRLFFFSSRRRHTRCSRDWSSDVCSSDLPAARPPRWWRPPRPARPGRPR